MSVEEYFDLDENDPDHRYEYIDGQVYIRPIEYRLVYILNYDDEVKLNCLGVRFPVAAL